jgi:hypothetical protein
MWTQIKGKCEIADMKHRFILSIQFLVGLITLYSAGGTIGHGEDTRLSAKVAEEKRIAELLVPYRDVRLTIEAVSESMKNDPRVLCVLRNTGTNDLEYECSLDTHGLDFRLFDASGEEIAVDSFWFQLHTLNNPNRIRTRYCNLPPGGRLTYVLDLREAFPSRWDEGATLRVNWLVYLLQEKNPEVSSEVDLKLIWEDPRRMHRLEELNSSPAGEDTESGSLPPVDQSNPAFILWASLGIALTVAAGCFWSILSTRRRVGSGGKRD